MNKQKDELPQIDRASAFV